MKSILHAITILLLASAANLACAQSEATVSPKVIDSWLALIGNWKVEGTIGPRSVTGSASFEWANGKFCVIGKQDWEIAGSGRTVHLAQIVGWDPGHNEIIEQGFSSVNGAATVHYRAPTKGSNVMEGTIDGVSGPDNQWSGTVKIERKGADEFQLTSTIDGDVVHSLKYVRKK